MWFRAGVVKKDTARRNDMALPMAIPHIDSAAAWRMLLKRRRRRLRCRYGHFQRPLTMQ